MRSNTPTDRTTQEFPEHRDPVHRGRRGSDQILEGWSWGRVTKIGTALTIVGGIIMALVSAIAAIAVLRPEFMRFRDRTNDRLDRIEIRQLQSESIQQLLPPMARLSCLTLQRDQSGTLGDAAGMPCDSLLRRTR